MWGINSISVADFLKIQKHALHAYSVGLLQGKAYRILDKHLKLTLSWYDLSIIEWKFLGQLMDNAQLSKKELVEKLDVTPMQIEEIAVRLHKKKLMVQVKTKGVFVITENGKELIGVVEVSVKERMKMLLAGLTRHELLVYLKVLMRIVDNGS